MKSYLKISLISLFVFCNLFSQTKFEAEFDYANFYVDDSTSRLEIYYSFSSAGMKITTSNDKKSISGILAFLIKDQTNSVVLDKSWNFSTNLNPASGSEPSSLTGLLSFYLKAGKYKCKLIGRDANDIASYDSLFFEIDITPRNKDRFSISDIELATKITQQSTNIESMFYKNTFEITPNPGLVFGQGLPVMYFYAELYNLDKDIKTEKLKVEHILYDFNRVEKYRKSKFVPRKNPSIVEVGQINVSKYPSGLYTFVIAVSDSIKNIVSTSAKNVFLYNPTVLASSNDVGGSESYLSSEVARMSVEEIDKEFDQCRYIASDKEKEAWRKLTELEAKRKFYYEFWNNRDIDRLTPQNEYKILYFQRVESANLTYSNSLHKEGWRSDRGRVFLTYGAPSEVMRYPYESETVPYEIWRYNDIEGGVEFVFADFSGFNDLQLIHSSKRGELSDLNWYNRIQR